MTYRDYGGFEEAAMTAEQEMLAMAEIEAERAREERRRVLEEAAAVVYGLMWPMRSFAELNVLSEAHKAICALIDKEPSRG